MGSAYSVPREKDLAVADTVQQQNRLRLQATYVGCIGGVGSEVAPGLDDGIGLDLRIHGALERAVRVASLRMLGRQPLEELERAFLVLGVCGDATAGQVDVHTALALALVGPEQRHLVLELRILVNQA